MKAETTKNDLVIQGILKEAFFEGTTFSVDQSLEKLQILDLSESKIRDESAAKRIHFKCIHSGNFTAGQTYYLSAKFHRYTVRGKFVLDHVIGTELVFKVPSELILENFRKSSRTQLPVDLRSATVVFVRTGALHGEGSFVPDDVSAEGFGGQLWLSEGFPVDRTSFISGSLQKSGIAADFCGSIVNARLIASDRPGFSLYKIGTQNSTPVEPSGSENRRSQKRYVTNFQISLRSKLFSEQVLVLQVSDISINGFSGTVVAGSVVSHVPVGSVFKIEGESTQVHLTSFSGDRFHFKISRRSVEEGIAWLRKMTPIIDPSARTTTRDLRELYRVFLQAGAVSTQYLKRHQLHQSLLVGRQSSSGENGYLHRWYLGADLDSAEGYLSAIRTSNNSWVLGDIAKVNDSDLKLKKSIQNFFHSFSEFAIDADSVGTLGIVWVKGHPFWQDWFARLTTDHSDLICSKLKMNYYRATVSSGTSNSKVKVKEVLKADYSLRRDVISLLAAPVRDYLKKAFDFSEEGLGSYELAREADWFKRHYLELTIGTNRYLAVATSPSPGISINRYLDSLFVFPIEINSHESLAEEVVEIGKAAAQNMNLVVPAVRLIHDSNVDYGGTEMVSLLMFPKAFLTF